jgi:hypothetical protein
VGLNPTMRVDRAGRWFSVVAIGYWTNSNRAGGSFGVIASDAATGATIGGTIAEFAASIIFHNPKSKRF